MLTIEQMSRAEKLQAMDELWESLSRDEDRLESPNWHADALEVFGYHRLLAKRFPFAIYYKNVGDVCLVWRVLDCRQNPA